MSKAKEYFTLQVGLEIFDSLNRRDLLAIIHVCTGALDMAIEGTHADGSSSIQYLPEGEVECCLYYEKPKKKRRKR